MRVYIPVNLPNKDELFVEKNIIQKMKSLGADIVYIDLKQIFVPLHLIASLIADEENITHFMIRDARHRLNECDVKDTNDFMKANKSIHFVKYDKNYNGMNILPYMWGANRQKLMKSIGRSSMMKFIQVIAHYVSWHMH